MFCPVNSMIWICCCCLISLFSFSSSSSSSALKISLVSLSVKTFCLQKVVHHELCQISHAPLHVNEIWEARAGIWLAIIIVFTLQHFTDWISIVFHLSCCNYNCLGTGLHAGRVSNWDSDVTYQSLTFMYTTCWLSSHNVCFFFSIIFFPVSYTHLTLPTSVYV